LLFYANFSLSAIAISPWDASVFAFTPAKAFVRELKCPAITRLAGSITCRVTQFLRGSLLSLSLTICGTANELAPYRFYARFCMSRQFIGYDDTQKAEGPAGRREPGKPTFSKLLHESWKTGLAVFHRNAK